MSKKSKALLSIFLLAIVMGPGPGLRLINPKPEDPLENYFFLGLPVVYAWGLFWYGVQLLVLAAAYWMLWKDEREGEREEETT